MRSVFSRKFFFELVTIDRSHVAEVCTDMQESMWARLRDLRPGARAIHAT